MLTSFSENTNLLKMNSDLKTFVHRNTTDAEFHDLMMSDSTDFPTYPGVYVFVSHNQKFVYPNGMSRIIYIGKAENLKARLSTHKRHLKELANLPIKEKSINWWYARYHYMSAFGCKVFCFRVKGKQEAKNLEHKLLSYFYHRYYAMPVGNGAISNPILRSDE